MATPREKAFDEQLVPDTSFIRRVVVENQRRIGALPAKIAEAILDASVTLEGGDKGTTNLRRKLAWLARNFRDIVNLCTAILETQKIQNAKLDQVLEGQSVLGARVDSAEATAQDALLTAQQAQAGGK